MLYKINIYLYLHSTVKKLLIIFLLISYTVLVYKSREFYLKWLNVLPVENFRFSIYMVSSFSAATRPYPDGGWKRLCQIGPRSERFLNDFFFYAGDVD